MRSTQRIRLAAMTDQGLLLSAAERSLDRRRLEESVDLFFEAEKMGADADRCAAGRWMAWMLLGRFSNAWEESDAIRRRGAPDPHRFWNGQEVGGKVVIVRSLHGLGDAIQNLRFLPLLRQRASRVLLEVPPSLVEIARGIPGPDEVVSWGNSFTQREGAWDVQMEVTELPYWMRCQVEDLPLATQYLRIPDVHARCASRWLGGAPHPRIGIAWAAGEWNPARSISLSEMTPLFDESDLTFWNIQGGSIRAEWEGLACRKNLKDVPELCADAGVLPLAAFISQLDVVITVDTLAAHLGGALGVRTWVMLQHKADWRWMTDREDSPWYPSVRLFRQPEDGDWKTGIHRVSDALAGLRSLNSKRAA
ncbi:glycosyltransferase family 9 protein [Acidobacteria bacterium AB60]|nr:glycosyltransferase family 9 protein [Acidobacteria bacterium AB60]